MDYSYPDLKFNPEAYARVIAKQDAEGHKGRGYHGDRFKAEARATVKLYSPYYNPNVWYGDKIWESVRDYRNSREW
jgi:hypothetical protein